MGLDVYAGTVSRYVAGDWLTIVQQVGAENGTPVITFRPNDPVEPVRDTQIIRAAVADWQDRLLARLGGSGSRWTENAEAPYLTDKPAWSGYGAVVLLAAYLERPDLAPGERVGKGLRRKTVRAVQPSEFSDAEAFKATSTRSARFATLLGGAEWCMPIGSHQGVFEAPTPNGTVLTMGSVDRLLDELRDLNSDTLRLNQQQLATACAEGPPNFGAAVAEMAPFGLAILTRLAEFAVENRLCWIMDY